MLGVVQMSLKKSKLVPTSLFAAFFVAEIIRDDTFSVPRLRVGFGNHHGETESDSRIYNGGDKQGGLLVFRRTQNHL